MLLQPGKPNTTRRAFAPDGPRLGGEGGEVGVDDGSIDVAAKGVCTVRRDDRDHHMQGFIYVFGLTKRAQKQRPATVPPVHWQLGWVGVIHRAPRIETFEKQMF